MKRRPGAGVLYLIEGVVYRTFSALPQELQGQLPGPEQVAKLLERIE